MFTVLVCHVKPVAYLLTYYCPNSMALYSLGLISETRSSLSLGCPDKGPYNNRYYICVFYTPHSSNLPFQILIFFDFFKFLFMYPNIPRNSCVYNKLYIFFSFLLFLFIYYYYYYYYYYFVVYICTTWLISRLCRCMSNPFLIFRK